VTRCVVGVDLGGSKVRALLGDASGATAAGHAEDTASGDAQAVVVQLAALCREVTRAAGVGWGAVSTVAVGVPGVVADSALRLAPNLPPFGEVNLRLALSEALGVEVVVDNDANMAARAEHRHGLGRGVDHFVFIAVGTGIGMGIVAGGSLQRGAAAAAGEIASLPVPFGTTHRPLEEIAGGAALARRYAALRRVDSTPVRAQDVYEAAARGDAAATTVVEEQAGAIALAVLAVQSVLDPALVVMGGGIGTRRDVLDRVHARLSSLTRRPPRVETSPLGERAGVLGAVDVARDRLAAASPVGRDGLTGPVDA
jgi:predicted NBD/HSP70 family sugar kinase